MWQAGGHILSLNFVTFSPICFLFTVSVARSAEGGRRCPVHFVRQRICECVCAFKGSLLGGKGTLCGGNAYDALRIRLKLDDGGI